MSTLTIALLTYLNLVLGITAAILLFNIGVSYDNPNEGRG